MKKNKKSSLGANLKDKRNYGRTKQASGSSTRKNSAYGEHRYKHQNSARRVKINESPMKGEMKGEEDILSIELSNGQAR